MFAMRLWLYLGCLMAVAGPACAQEAVTEEPEGLIKRIQARMRENLERLPDYTCLQTVERWMRPSPKKDFERVDTLRLEVGVAGDREIYAWRDAAQFEDKELREMISRGTIGSGDFALHAKNVFLGGSAVYFYKGLEDFESRKVHRYEYGVAIEKSRYRIRVPPEEAVVGFSGSFLVDAGTLDVVRLEVTADEIPEKLGLAEANVRMDYARLRIGAGEFLLPKGSLMTMATVNGDESKNQTEFSTCRQYVSESKVQFAGDPGAERTNAGVLSLPPRAVLEIELASEINLEAAAVGDQVEAVLKRPVEENGQIVAPAGATVRGNLVRLERNPTPFDHYEVGLKFHTLEARGVKTPITATLDEVGKAAGLVREQKRMDPVFTKRRSTRFDILVRETPKGQGVLHWEAKHPRMKKGLDMRWVIED